MKTMTIAAALLAATSAVPALAQAGPPDPYGDATVTKADAETRAGQRFAELDANKDNSLTVEERRAGGGGRGGGGGGGGPGGANAGPQDKAAYVANQLRMFDQQDGNKDGSLTKAERDAWRAQMQQRFQQGGGA